MTIEELAKLYKDGADWNDEMEAYQNKYIVDNIQEFHDEYGREYEMGFDQYIGLMKGLWQAKHGFTRSFDINRLRRKK